MSRVEVDHDAIARLFRDPNGGVADHLRETGKEILNRAIPLARKDTRQMVNSWDYDVDVNETGKLELRVGVSAERNARVEGNATNADVTIYNELGTSQGMSPQPALRAALAALRPK